MQIIEQLKEEYQEYKNKNTDPYGQAVIDFTERWANLMEARIENGEKVKDYAEETMKQADTEGITGFMYGCAVKALAYFWVHGEPLRLWHNKETAIGDEGDKANESGGVLNPAIITIGPKE